MVDISPLWDSPQIEPKQNETNAYFLKEYKIFLIEKSYPSCNFSTRILGTGIAGYSQNDTLTKSINIINPVSAWQMQVTGLDQQECSNDAKQLSLEIAWWKECITYNYPVWYQARHKQ